MKRILTLYQQAFSGLGRDIWWLGLICFINRAGSMVFPFMTLYFTTRLGFSDVQAGWLLFVYGAGSLSGSYLGGLLSARLGALRVLILSLMGGGLTFLLFPLFKSYHAIMITCFVLGVLADSFRPAIMSAFTIYSTPENQVRAFALLRLALNGGMAAGPAIGGLLAAIDYKLIFFGDGLTCILASLAVPILFREHMRQEKAVGPTSKEGGLALKPLKDPGFMAFIVMVLGLAVIIFQFIGTYPLHLNREYGLQEYHIGSLLAFNAFFLCSFEMVTVHMLEKRNPFYIFAVGSFILSLGFALLPLGSSFAFALVCMLFFTIGEMLSLPFSNSLVAKMAGDTPGPYMGVYSAVFSLGMMIGPGLGLMCYHRWGADLFWYSIGFVGVLVWLGTSLLARRPASVLAEGEPAST